VNAEALKFKWKILGFQKCLLFTKYYGDQNKDDEMDM
jgi:hypothetical protein